MMQIFPIFFIDLKDPYFKVERVTENVRNPNESYPYGLYG